jgi:hypothetical protein
MMTRQIIWNEIQESKKRTIFVKKHLDLTNGSRKFSRPVRLHTDIGSLKWIL